MADDLWDREETAGNADPWVPPANALAPKRRFTLVPVDHDPWAPIQSAPTLNDGGNLSGSTARRFPGERAVAPRGTALRGPGELEDPEAAAFTPRTGREHLTPPISDMSGAGGDQWPESDLRDSPKWGVMASPTGVALLTAALAKGLLVDTPEAMERLIRRGYQPGTGDTQAVEDAFVASGVAAAGSFAGARPKGSLGTFIGRKGAEGLAQAGRPTAMKAIEMAERLDARGVSEPNIRKATNALIETEDPKLGGVHKGEDGKWRLELDDSASRFRQVGPRASRLGRELHHPELYAAHPDMRASPLWRRDSKNSGYLPDDDLFLIGMETPSRKSAILHEVDHAAAKRNDLSPGASPEDFADGGSGAHMRLPGETPKQTYDRVLGEQYADIVERRMDLTPKARRDNPPGDALQQRRADLGIGIKPSIIPEKHGPARSSGRRSADPDEPSAFEQASEGHWNDLAKTGEVGQQSMWSDMGAHLNKPGQRGGGPGKAPSELWSREANLVLAQMHKRGEWPSDIATKMSDLFGRRYTEDRIASQLESLGLVGSNRKLPSSAVGEWQPDAVAILQSDRVQGMPAAQIAKLIEEETGQITTKNSVIGKLNRLRQERQRQDLAEDLAKRGIKLKAAGVPAHDGDAKRRRRSSWSLWDRIIYWGGY